MSFYFMGGGPFGQAGWSRERPGRCGTRDASWQPDAGGQSAHGWGRRGLGGLYDWLRVTNCLGQLDKRFKAHASRVPCFCCCLSQGKDPVTDLSSLGSSLLSALLSQTILAGPTQHHFVHPKRPFPISPRHLQGGAAASYTIHSKTTLTTAETRARPIPVSPAHLLSLPIL